MEEKFKWVILQWKSSGWFKILFKRLYQKSRQRQPSVKFVKFQTSPGRYHTLQHSVSVLLK